MNAISWIRTLVPIALTAVLAGPSHLPASADPAGEGAAPHGPHFTTITIPSADGLMMTADVYAPHPDPATPFIVLFHQAGWSRGEYREIAPRLNALGFNCMAIDQRSGEAVAGVANETVRRAKAAGKGTTYVDAIADMEAALTWARHITRGPLLAWGSSYSAALVLKIAGDRPDAADAVLAFSPGEYFVRLGKPATWIRDAARRIHVPVFITSARGETDAWSPIFEAIPSKEKAAYRPATSGNHGSRALWKQFEDSAGYWTAVTAFLERFEKE